MNIDILQALSYGLYAVGVKDPSGRPSACIVNTVFQVMAEPAAIAVSLSHENFSTECIERTGEFTVSVLSEETAGATIANLGFRSGRDVDKLAKVSHSFDPKGYPVLDDNICCWFRCRVFGKAETETHTVCLCYVVDGSEEHSRTPMTYDFYHKVIKGRAPKRAPTFSAR